jgi:Flagellar hook-length control protein FliK
MDIVAAIQQQMLGVLIDALGKPSASAGQNTNAPVAAPLGLSAGETINATVATVKPDGGLVLNIKGQPVQAEIKGSTLPEAARQPGATIQLKVETTGQTPRLAFIAAEAPTATSVQTSATAAPFTHAQSVRITNPAQASLAPPPDPVTAAVNRATTEAAAKQGSAAPLYADLAALVLRPEATLPRPIVALAQAILASRLDGDRPVTAGDLKQAIAQTGIAHEASLARGEPAVLDAKTLLTTLRDLVRNDAPRFTPPTPDTEPPRRDGAVLAQKATVPLLATETDPKVITTTLAREADQAVERLKLHQIASLPEPRINDPARVQQLSFELPIALGHQTAMAGFRIEREKRRAKEANGQPVDIWGVRFAIDADVLGPVHAHVRLSGLTISVSLWAEDTLTHRAFVAAIPMLEAALSDNALEIGDLMVFPGRPADPKRAAQGQTLQGHFLDRSS